MGNQEPLMTRRIPRSGEAVPAIGLGSSRTFDVSGAGELDEVKEVLRLFVSLGGRVVDSSPMYGRAESVIGDVATQLGIGGKLFLATKVWTTGRDAGIKQAQESMNRMRTKRLDLIQVHNLVDVDTHLKWLKEWKEAGKVRYVGITHYRKDAHEQLAKYVASKEVDFIQVNYSMAEREAEDRLLPAARESGTAVLANRPFAVKGLFDRVEGRPLPDWASEIDVTSWAQFFLKYILANPAVTCIIPATRNPKHLTDDVTGGRGRLPDEKMRQRMLAVLKG
jgi:diketogulonate reductase-like aldo/keto reductase